MFGGLSFLVNEKVVVSASIDFDAPKDSSLPRIFQDDNPRACGLDSATDAHHTSDQHGVPAGDFRVA